jgi:transposase
MESVEKSTTNEVFASPGLPYDELVNSLDSARIEVESLRIKNEELAAKVKYYEEQIRLAAVKKYGASSEKNIHPDQLTIFNEAEKESRPDADEPTIEEITYKRKKGGPRKSTAEKYDGLPVEEIHYELSADDRGCERCGEEMKEMGTETHDELVVEPAKVSIRRHVQHIYVCENEACEDEADGTNIVMARAPEPPIPHSPAGPSMIADIMNKKYSAHLPLYRQSKQYEYEGITIPRQNMANWVIKGAGLLDPLYARMHGLMLLERYLHADETPMQVLSEPGKTAASKSYVWVYATGRFRRRIILYEYCPSRSGENPKRFLAGFSGYLQTDAYAAYNAVENVTSALCWSHSRREYVDALKALPKNADRSRTLCSEALIYIDKLFELERSCKDMTPERRFSERLEKSKPVVDAYHEWLLEKKKLSLPQGKLGKAVNYSLKHWEGLCTFLEDGEIELSNNDCENAIRPFAVGRGNWLFAKSQSGATASAVCYSIIETAKANRLSPFHYLKFLFEILPNINPDDQTVLDALLPWSESLPQEVRVAGTNTTPPVSPAS